jgi:hypothetical protein
MQKAESKIFPEILSFEKQFAEAKTLQSFQFALNLPRSLAERLQKSRAAAAPWTHSPVHLPVEASSFNEEIEPLVARRTILLLKKVRCRLNLEQR